MSKRLPEACRQIDVGVLLDAFVRSRNYVPHGAHRVRSREELPLALQFHTRQADEMVWRAWSEGASIWFVKAKVVSCEDAAGLQITFFDADGCRDSSGVWIWLQDRRRLSASARSSADPGTTDGIGRQRCGDQAMVPRLGTRTACAGGSDSGQRQVWQS